MGDLDDIVGEFLAESRENLDAFDADLLALERDPAAAGRIASAFRTIHTIKGTCGFLGLGTLESVTHAGESLLTLLRDGDLALGPEIATALLRLSDAVRSLLAAVEATGAEGDADHSDLIATLQHLQGGPARPAPALPPDPPAPPPVGAAPDPVPPAPPPVAAAPFAAAPAPVAAAPDPAPAPAAVAADSTIRVDVGLLDQLMDLVGELVLARNQILQHTSTSTDAALLGTSQRLNLIATELQEGVMKTRMQPIGTVWSKFPRVARDLTLALGKRARVVLEGEDTELDKTIIEAIKDPLTHLVRNAVDHGIEAPAARIAAGKPEEGTLTLRAFHAGGQVNIEIADDGAGIDPARVLAKGVERGLVPADQAARLGEREILSLIFAPGFSTAAQVTNVSGRGVGMDVVRTNIERIGGTVDVSTVPGAGTTFKVKIPLTLAIIPALVVAGGAERYAIPQASLLELVRLEGAAARQGIEMISGAPVHRLRGNLLPLVHLDRELRVGDAGVRDVVNIVVLQADAQPFGLVVDGVHDTQEIVVKPLGSQLKGLPTYAGATILGDGRVALILDVVGLAQRAGVVAEHRERALVADPGAAPDTDGRETLLVVGVGAHRRVAVPLSAVARLEKFPRSAVEHTGRGEVVQYRGQILPLLSLSGALGAGPDPAAAAAPTIEVVVCTAPAGHAVGVVVDRVVDIVEERRRPAGDRAPRVVDRRVTDVVDLPALVAALDPGAPAGSPPLRVAV